MLSLLFIEDDEDILSTLYAWFETRGYLIDCARDGLDAFRRLQAERFDCIILDLMLPGQNGLEVCTKMRSAGIHTPVIILTALDSIEEKVAGLEAGADDYLVKPFSLRELEARIKALLRRPGNRASELVYGELRMLPGQKKVFRKDTELLPTPTGFTILEILMRRAPDLVMRQELERMIWGDEIPGPTALRNHIFELRRVLDKPFAWNMLETVPHVGYRLRNAQA